MSVVSDVSCQHPHILYQRTYVGGVDGPHTAEDLVQLGRSRPQVRQVPSPPGRQRLRTVQLKDESGKR